MHWHNVRVECWYFVLKQSFVCQNSLPGLLCESCLDVMHVHAVVLMWHAISWCKTEVRAAPLPALQTARVAGEAD